MDEASRRTRLQGPAKTRAGRERAPPRRVALLDLGQRLTEDSGGSLIET